jgi:hypothetical protein
MASIFDMSITQLMIAWAQTLSDIIEDLTKGEPFMATIFRKDRLIYVGFTLVVIAFFIDA